MPADDRDARGGWRRAFRLPLGRRQAEREVDDEIAFHLAMREQSLRAGGLTDTGAFRRARERFGSVDGVRQAVLRIDRPQVARVRAGSALRDFAQDLGIAARGLRRAPGFALVAVLTLAVGIGATAAIFSVAYGVLLRPLPFADPDRLVQLTAAAPASYDEQFYLSGPEFLDLPAAAPSLAGLAALAETEPTLATDEGRPERVRVAAATASLFPTLGLRAARGRVYGEAEDRRGANDVVVLDHALWQRRFGGDPAIVGGTVRLGGQPHTVVGVLPPDVHLRDYEAFVPLALDPADLRPRGSHYLHVLARLRPGATLDGARAELAAYARRAVAEYRGDYADPAFTFGARPLRDVLVGDTRPTLLVLLGAVALLLVLACVNVANLLLVRAEARQREIAVRVALGAGRGRLVRQLLTETLLLAAVGAAIGLPLAVLGVRALLALNPDVVPPGTSVAVDGVVLLVAAGVVVLTALLAGLAPALQASAGDLRAAIAAGGLAGGRRGGRLRGALVAAQIAVATLVLVGAGLVARSFWRLQQVDPGFRSAQVLTFDVRLAPTRPPQATEVPAAWADLLDRLRAIPGTRSAAVVSHLPMSGETGDWVLEVEGHAPAPGEALLSPNFTIVSADYLATLDIPIVAGRDFAATDRPTDPPAVIVSARLARALWRGADPLGRRVRVGGPPGRPNPWMTVIGVAGDVRGEGLAAEPRPTYYMLDAQFPHMVGGVPRGMAVVVRTVGEPTAVAAGARRAVRDFDPEMAVTGLRPLQDVVAGTVTRPRFAAAVLAAFAGAALLLAIVGVHGVLAYAVTRRRREMGIRMALGAQAAQVRRLVLRTGLGLAAAGLVVGTAAALLASRLLAAVLYGVSATDPATFATAVATLALAALAASWLPAHRATRVPPAEALRPD